MAQSGFTPISLYYSSTAAALPLSSNLAFGELAINILDGKLYYKNSVGTVTLLSSSAIASGSFTTLSYSTSFTGTASATITDNSANPALRVTQTGSGLSLLIEDSANPDASPFVVDATGNVGIGVVPSAWNSTQSALQIGTIGSIRGGLAAVGITVNVYFGAASTWIYQTTAAASMYQQTAGTHSWTTIPSGTAGTTATLNQVMFLDASGNLGLGIGSSSIASLQINKNITGGVTAYGVVSNGIVQADVTTGAYYFSTYAATVAGTCGLLRHYTATQGAFTGTVTSQYGFIVGTLIGATNNYGFYGDIPSGTNRYNLYMAGSADNYMAGNLGIGTVPGAGTNFAISKALTGAAVSFAININAVIQSDVTTAAYGVGTTLSTAAAAFTLANIYYHPATQGSIGNGSIVSTQLGFLASSNMVGATNNYGFYSGLPKPTVGTFVGSTALNVSQTGTTVTVTTTAAHNLVNGQVVTVALTANATALVSGVTCTILTLGTTDFTLIGAASNTVGVSFTVNAVTPLGTGTVTLNSQGSGKVVAGAGTVGVSTTFTYTATSATFAAVTVLTGPITIASNYNLYCAGTADNYMAGKLWLGSTAPGTINLANYLDITGAANAYGTVTASTIRSSVISSATMFYSLAATEAALFTLTSLTHYAAAQSTFANTAVTTQVGFQVQSTLIGAVNNYGFYGSIPAGTNRYNLYLAGSANNYMAGSLGIGNLASAGQTLYLAQSITGNVNSTAVRQQGVVDMASVTATCYAFDNVAILAASGSLTTLPSYVHYNAQQGTFGTNSAVTTQLGFNSAATLIGATNNIGFYASDTAAVTAGKTAYGFYSLVNTASGGGTAYGFYAAGTAPNVFNNVNVLTKLGYTTGGGGAVTQTISRATAVTLDKCAGQITMFTAAGSATWATFQVNNSLVTANDTVVLSVNGATNSYVMTVSSIAAGAFIILFSSVSGTASDTPKINFTVIKGAIS